MFGRILIGDDDAWQDVILEGEDFKFFRRRFLFWNIWIFIGNDGI